MLTDQTPDKTIPMFEVIKTGDMSIVKSCLNYGMYTTWSLHRPEYTQTYMQNIILHTKYTTTLIQT